MEAAQDNPEKGLPQAEVHRMALPMEFDGQEHTLRTVSAVYLMLRANRFVVRQSHTDRRAEPSVRSGVRQEIPCILSLTRAGPRAMILEQAWTAACGPSL